MNKILDNTNQTMRFFKFQFGVLYLQMMWCYVLLFSGALSSQVGLPGWQQAAGGCWNSGAAGRVEPSGSSVSCSPCSPRDHPTADNPPQTCFLSAITFIQETRPVSGVHVQNIRLYNICIITVIFKCKNIYLSQIVKQSKLNSAF